MKVSAATTYERILDRGVDMMSVTGLAGVTFGALSQAVGMSKSGLFAHFRSKDEIQLRLMDHAESLVRKTVLDPAMAAPAGLPRLTALMRNWLGWTRRAGLRGGCPIAAAMFELDDLDGEVRNWVRDAEGKSNAVLADLVAQAIAGGGLRGDIDVDQLVWELHGIYLGHHVSSRFHGDPRADRRAWTAFEAVIDRARL